MQIGDTVILRAKVTDIKEADGVVLTVALSGDFREHWFSMKELEVEAPPPVEGSGTTSATGLLPKPESGQTHPTPPTSGAAVPSQENDPRYAAALDLVKKHGYSDEAAKKIVDQTGVEAILSQFGTKTEAPQTGAPAAGQHSGGDAPKHAKK